MPQSSKVQPQIIDLTREIPQGVKVSGLSAPKFDGANYYRQPVGPESGVDFTVPQTSFVQLEYQLFSPDKDINSALKLDGKTIGTAPFPAGKFLSNIQLGDFVAPGPHHFELAYDCLNSCTKISQYWTRVHLLDASQLSAIEPVGFSAEHWKHYAPVTPLKIEGTGSLNFDGVNYWKAVQASQVRISWPPDIKPLDISFQLNGSQDFRVTTRLGNKVLGVRTVKAKQGIDNRFNIVGQSQEHTLTFTVECLNGPRTTCTSLYFPEMTVLKPATHLTSGLGALLGAVVICGAALWLLALGPRRVD